MLKIWAMFVAIFFATQLHSESLRQFHSETSTPLDEIVSALEQRLPDMVYRLGEGSATIAYSGNRPPIALTTFLEASFETLAPDILRAGRTFSLSLSMSGDKDGTVLSLMLMGDFPGSGFSLPAKSTMMMDGGNRDACEGQIVTSHPSTAAETAKIYRTHLESDGFSFPDASLREASFLIGQAHNCSVAMYLHPDQDATMVVIRYLEE